MKVKQYLISVVSVTCVLLSCNEPMKEPTNIEIEHPKTLDSVLSQKITDLKVDTIAEKLSPVKINEGGKANLILKWKDKRGLNLLILHTVGPNAEADGKYKLLYASQYIMKNEENEVEKKIWEFRDSIRNCEFDVILNFVSNCTLISDVDKDGFAEICFVYRYACVSDVCPIPQRLVLSTGLTTKTLTGFGYEAGNEIAARDENDLILEKYKSKSEDDWEYYKAKQGRYDNENDFESAPTEILKLARENWIRSTGN